MVEPAACWLSSSTSGWLAPTDVPSTAVITSLSLRPALAAGLPLSAGVTVYVAASDLIPEVNKEPGVKMALVVFVGVAFLFVLDRIFHVH